LLRFGPGSSFLDLLNVLCEAAELRLIVKVLTMPPRQDVLRMILNMKPGKAATV
jgi:hypothetical protein